MITELRIPHSVTTHGFVFTLYDIYMSVHNLDGELMALLHVLDENGHRAVRTQAQFESQIDFWLVENIR